MSAPHITITPGRSTLSITAERQIVYLLIDVVSPAAAAASLPVNICLVLDTSSSMRGERLFHVKQAALQVLHSLGERDRLAVVAFSDRARVVVESQLPTDPAAISQAIMALDPRGGTEIATGMRLGLEQLRAGSQAGALTHMVLLTDGRTYGDEQACLQLADLARQRGIGITTLGIGEEWNEDLLEGIAASEQGRTSYITALAQVGPVFTHELARVRATTAQRSELRLGLMPGAQVRGVASVLPHLQELSPVEVAPGAWAAPMGALSSLERQRLLVEVVLPPLAGSAPPIEIELAAWGVQSGSEPRTARASCRLALAELEAGEVSAEVLGHLRRVVALRLQRRAWQEVAGGATRTATRLLAMAGTRLLEVGECELAQTLRDEARRLAQAGQASADGRKRIRYGTRGLLTSQRCAAS